MAEVTKKQLDEAVQNLKDIVGAEDEATGALIDQIITLLSLPDEQFEILAPGVIQSYQQTVNNPNDFYFITITLIYRARCIGYA